MKLTVMVDSFRDAVEDAFAVIRPNSPKPILMNVKIVAIEEGIATLIATNLEQGIRRKLLGVHVEEFGEAILGLRVLQVAKLAEKSAEIRIQADTDGVNLSVGKSTYHFSAEDPSLFPEFPDFPTGSPYHFLPGDAFKRLIRKTFWATDQDSTRYALSGTLFDLTTEGSLSIVGTDGRRLAMAMTPCQTIDGGTDGSGMPVVPVQALKLLLRLLGPEHDARLSLDPKHSLSVLSNGSTVYTRLVEGRFPDFRSIIPAGRTATATATVGPLLQALGQASIATSADSRGVDFTFRDGTLTLEGHAPDVGEGRVIIPVGYDHPGPIEVTLVPDLLADALRALDPEQEVTLSLTDAKGPVVLRADSDLFTFVVMPITREP